MKSIFFLLGGLLYCAQASAGDFAGERRAMVEDQIARRGVTNSRVLESMRSVPRHFFVNPKDIPHAYEDRPLRIGEGQTISQPYIVALMSALMDLKGGERVLEIGTGSGYQAAVLSRLCGEVYTIEIIEKLHKRAVRLFKKGGYANIFPRLGDGAMGWEEKAPFDAIMITAAAKRIPPPLIRQLKDGGRLVLPLETSSFSQALIVATKKQNTLNIRKVLPVLFVPMTGKNRE